MESKNHDHEANVGANSSHVGQILKILGEDTVLLKVKSGEQVPTTKDWLHTPIDRMHDTAYLQELEDGNIGVLLGMPSGNLITINIDDDQAFESFTKVNGLLAVNTLITKGERGGNIWVRLTGRLPSTRNFFNSDGILIGELRGDGHQTIISGTHPSGVEYRFINEAPPYKIKFNDLRWPEEWQLSWSDEAEHYNQLIKFHGDPYTISGKNSVKLNQPWFVARYALENLIVYEPNLGSFYEYQNENGLWIRKSEDSVKKDLGHAIKIFADEVRKSQLIFSRTNHSLGGLTGLLRGEVEKNEVFDNRPKNVIHLANCMLNLDSSPPDILPFNPNYYSRNQSPIPYDPKADCPIFKNDLLATALPPEDIDLLQKYFGQCLLGINLSQRVLILTGTAGGGKSTLVTLIERIIGEENVAVLRTNQLESRFETFRYVDRSLLVAKDVASNFLNQKGTYKIKALVGGDLEEAERKNANVTYKFYGTFNVIITSNTRLKVSLDSDVEAWRRRLLIVSYRNPKPEKEIPQLVDSLYETEGSGIINWMIDGAVKLLDDLKKGGGFPMTEALKERVDNLLDESDSVRIFVKKRVIHTEDSNLTTDELVAGYFNFCDERDWTPLSTRNVQSQLKNIMMEIHRSPYRNDICRGDSLTTHRGYSKVGFVD